jgi:hypothetical protein
MIAPGNDLVSNLGLVITINITGFIAHTVNPILGSISIAAGIVYVLVKIKKELKK